jgi:cytosine/adenosine deaminase-related metal-dependent hydrolase
MRILTADAIFSAEHGFIPGAALVIDADGCIQDLVAEPSDDLLEKAEHFSGVLCPGFINAHCHLELSHMKGKVPMHTGFTGFAQSLIPQRKFIPDEEIEAITIKADETMFANGINGVGDISNVALSFAAKRNSKLQYHTFIELLGFNPSVAQQSFSTGKELKSVTPQRSSLSPHAPYSVSDELMKLISDEEYASSVVTIHNQESQAEAAFSIDASGAMQELYRFFGTDISWYKGYGVNSLRHYLPLLKTNGNLLLVHNTFTSADDIRFANSIRKNLYWCLCPNANLYIENALPDIDMLMNEGCALTIGTDSLASNHSLSVLDELKVIHKSFPAIQIADLLKWATHSGAQALGMKSLGSFEIGKRPGVILLKGIDAESISSEASVTRIF